MNGPVNMNTKIRNVAAKEVNPGLFFCALCVSVPHFSVFVLKRYSSLQMLSVYAHERILLLQTTQLLEHHIAWLFQGGLFLPLHAAVVSVAKVVCRSGNLQARDMFLMKLPSRRRVCLPAAEKCLWRCAWYGAALPQ